MSDAAIRSLCVLCVLGAMPVAALASESTVDRKVPADARGEVLISNVSGNVDVRGWDRNEVQVTGRIDEGVDRVDVDTSGGRTTIKVNLKRGSHDGGEAMLEIQVPRGSSVEVSSTSADVTSRGVVGAQRLNTVSGEIIAEISGGNDSQVRTVSGDITVKGDSKTGALRVSSVSGSLELTNGAGKLDVVTVSGDARVHMVDASEVNARTTSGELELRAKLLRDARISAEGVSGDMSLDLGNPDGLTLEIESFSGDITGCLATDVKKVSNYGPGVRLNSHSGNGTARVRAKTLSGDIEVCDH